MHFFYLVNSYSLKEENQMLHPAEGEISLIVHKHPYKCTGSHRSSHVLLYTPFICSADRSRKKKQLKIISETDIERKRVIKFKTANKSNKKHVAHSFSVTAFILVRTHWIQRTGVNSRWDDNAHTCNHTKRKRIQRT